jgi:Asp/Glu/hydantoin racemase
VGPFPESKPGRLGLIAGFSELARLLVVNPNTSQNMTTTIRASAEAAALAWNVEVNTISASAGPESIEGRVDEIVSVYWTLDAVMRVIHEFDGYGGGVLRSPSSH